MSPIAIMDRDKRNTLVFTVNAGKHHMTRVERVNEIRRKGILLFHHIGSPVKKKMIARVTKTRIGAPKNTHKTVCA